MAEILKAQLALYLRPIDADLSDLAEDKMEPFSNEKHICIVLMGEKEVRERQRERERQRQRQRQRPTEQNEREKDHIQCSELFRTDHIAILHLPPAPYITLCR
jgi:hypothetical protein